MLLVLPKLFSEGDYHSGLKKVEVHHQNKETVPEEQICANWVPDLPTELMFIFLVGSYMSIVFEYACDDYGGLLSDNVRPIRNGMPISYGI